MHLGGWRVSDPEDIRRTQARFLHPHAMPEPPPTLFFSEWSAMVFRWLTRNFSVS